ncbi:MAG: glycosyltransferase [Bacteroidales bacterium]
MRSNKNIHGLWIGSKLSSIELLCINSFIANGHKFHLWVYEDLENILPEAVILEDASKIIPKEEVFYYKNSNQYGHGKGSFAGFSDIFRYKLLYMHGGWWSDMDVICLKSLDFEQEYVFRTHHNFAVVGNIMKCPKNSPLMKKCFEDAKNSVDGDNLDWDLPIKILNDNIAYFELQEYIQDISNEDSWLVVRKYLLRNKKPNKKWFVMHLLNEEWRKNKINKDAIPPFSFVGKTLKLYNLYNHNGFWQVIKNLYRIIIPALKPKQTIWFLQRKFWQFVRIFKPKKSA